MRALRRACWCAYWCPPLLEAALPRLPHFLHTIPTERSGILRPRASAVFHFTAHRCVCTCMDRVAGPRPVGGVIGGRKV